MIKNIKKFKNWENWNERVCKLENSICTFTRN